MRFLSSAGYRLSLLGSTTALILNQLPAHADANLTYQVEDNALTATINGIERVLFDLVSATPRSLFQSNSDEAAFLANYEHGITWVERVEDLDQDGLVDAIVGLSIGGNCCAPGYAIVSAMPDGTFRFSPLLDWAWNPPELISATTGEIWLETRTDDRLYRHAYQNGEVLLLEERVIAERAAIAELRAVDVINGSSPTSLEVDLDADGLNETMRCTVWERWQSLICQFERVDGSVLPTVEQGDSPEPYEVNLGCFRYGVLPSMTGGMHDLVCDADAIARWNGRAYEWQSNRR